MGKKNKLRNNKMMINKDLTVKLLKITKPITQNKCKT